MSFLLIEFNGSWQAILVVRISVERLDCVRMFYLKSVRYLTLEETIDAFSMSILPFLSASTHAKCISSILRLRFLEALPAYLDQRQISSVRFSGTVNIMGSVLSALEVFDQLISLHLTNVQLLEDLGRFIKILSQSPICFVLVWWGIQSVSVNSYPVEVL